ncbi:MAG: transporter permease [Pseudonocardiales bacterium]|nr:transporter permease [Pseudonocardiales bacterium]
MSAETDLNSPPQLAAAAQPETERKHLLSKLPSFSGLGVFGAFVLMLVVFVVMRPGTFSKSQTWLSILDASAIPAIIAVGLTLALIVGEFDLSIGATLSLGMAISVTLLSKHGVDWRLAAIIAILLCAIVGLVNGAVVTRGRVNSFIATLAMSNVVGGVESRITDQKTLAQDIPAGFTSFGTKQFLSLSYAFWIAVILAAVLFVVCHYAQLGRRLYAVGSAAEAARLAGLRVRWLRTIGFTSAAAAAGLAGVCLAAQSSSYYPNAGQGYLLPAYAAAFLGTAIAAGRFAIVATVFGVVFLQSLQTGLTVLNVSSWVVLVMQGLVLIGAVMLARFRGSFTRTARR